MHIRYAYKINNLLFKTHFYTHFALKPGLFFIYSGFDSLKKLKNFKWLNLETSPEVITI